MAGIRYAWVITKDVLFDQGDMPGKSSAGVAGPRSASADDVHQAEEHGTAFTMYDDDGVLYYRGRFWCSEGPGATCEHAFAPLDGFGAPDSGCTEIRYRQSDGTFEAL